jgi:uncharacterized peroxidase-related enzyme
MSTFTLHTLQTAPAAARDTMDAVTKKFGFLPNLIREMAEAPSTVKGYAALGELLEQTSLTPIEQQLVLAGASLANTCEYCVAAHSAGLRQAGLSPDQLDAVREGRSLRDSRLEALRALTIELVETRGRPTLETLRAFREAGYDNRQLLEVILGVGMKTISNYVNHVADTPLDGELRAFAWSAGAATHTSAGR